MIVYWLMFLAPALAIVTPWRLDRRAASLMWFLVGAWFAVLIGLRYQVGGDWFNYLNGFERVKEFSLGMAARYKDPGYSLLNWLVSEAGGSIYWVNLFCGTILMIGTVQFCRRQPRPWPALLVAVPYMLIVVGMGYTRQATALGFVLLGLAALGEGRTLNFVLWVTLGAMFHKTAALLIPIAAFAGTRRRLWKFVWVLIAAVMVYRWVLQDQADTLWQNYVTADMESYGAGVRVAMNAVPAVLFFIFRKRLNPDGRDDRIWVWISLISLACVPLVAMSSTAVDRMSLYFIPIQLYVFSRLPNLAGNQLNRSIVTLGIIGYYAAVQWTWLNLATHARYWVPYHFAPL